MLVLTTDFVYFTPEKKKEEEKGKEEGNREREV